MSAQHTAVPWLAAAYSSVVGLPITAQPDKTKNSVVICGVRGERTEAEANAKFIVTACNSHADLMTALDQIARFQECFADASAAHKKGASAAAGESICLVLAKHARAAIAKAEGQ